jgi:hypothetical protein
MENRTATAPVLLRGIIARLTKRRASYEAVFTEADKVVMERTAIVAALVGLNDIALNLSTSTQFTDTVGDLVTFELNGNEIRAWIWWSVFEDGDRSKLSRSRRGLGGLDTRLGDVAMEFCPFTLIANVVVGRYLNSS